MPIPSEKNVLIVESRPTLTHMLESHFDSHGIKVFSATTGVGALKKTEQYHPDLIVLDTSLSDMDSTDFVVQIRENWKTSWIPVLAVSGFPFMRAKCLDSGCNVFLPKPFTTDELVSSIKELLKKTVVVADPSLVGAY